MLWLATAWFPSPAAADGASRIPSMALAACLVVLVVGSRMPCMDGLADTFDDFFSGRSRHEVLTGTRDRTWGFTARWPGDRWRARIGVRHRPAALTDVARAGMIRKLR